MKAEQRHSFWISADAEVQYERLRARIAHEVEGDQRAKVLAVSDKSGHDILVVDAPKDPSHYANGTKFQPVAKEDVANLRIGMERRCLEKRVADLEAEVVRRGEGGHIYSASDVLSAMRDANETLSARHPESLTTISDLNDYGQRLALSAIERAEKLQRDATTTFEKERTAFGAKEAAYVAGKKLLEEKLRAAAKETERAETERDSALRDRQAVITTGDRYVQLNAGLEKKVRGLEAEKTNFLAAIENVKAERTRALAKSREQEESYRTLQAERAQEKAAYERTRAELEAALEKLRGYEEQKNAATAAAEPPLLTSASSSGQKPAGPILIPDPMAETTPELFGYIAFRRNRETDRYAVEDAFRPHETIKHHRATGRGAATWIYRFGPIDAELDQIVARLKPIADESRTEAQMKAEIREYFTAGDQCGYNPSRWKPDARVDKLTLALGARLSYATIENKLTGIKIQGCTVSNLTRLLERNFLQKPKEVYKQQT